MKFNISSVKLAVSKAGLVLKKHSPEILLGVGAVSTVAGVALCGKQTLKADAIVRAYEDQLHKVELIHDGIMPDGTEFTGEYSENDYKKDKITVYVNMGKDLAKCYAPVVTFVGLGLVCFLSAHNIISKRNVALAGAYKLSEEAFRKYRDRVVESLGEDKDREFYYGFKDEEVEKKVKDEKTGESKTVKTTVKNVPYGQMVSQYSRIFDEANVNWSKDPSMNKAFVQNAQDLANQKLRAQGYIFLNDVYKLLGFEPSSAGQLVGWVLNGDGDGFIDFNMYELNNPAKVEFINGDERSIILDFNVDGVMYELI